MAAIKVLYIDDEENNLNSFKASFRRLYEIYTAESASQAIDVLKQVQVHVIISDQRMPDVTGVEFFKTIKTIYPEPVRILLTGYADIEALADAINEGDVYRYVTKPWNDIELNNSIRNAYDVYKTRTELREKVVELQKTNDELNRFIYSISHELRAPLASALGVINLAKFENVYQHDEKGAEYWHLLEECCNKLDYNINSTLQYYKNNRYEGVLEEIDFNKLVQEIISLHKLGNAVGDKIKFNVNIAQQQKFVGDKFRIEVILGNIISNSIRYQKPEEEIKTISVDIKVTVIDAFVKISDNGLGIPSKDINKIFTQFFRSRNQKGTGLGLFIVKEALDKLNGKISVESQTDKGTTITVRIPNYTAGANNKEHIRDV